MASNIIEIFKFREKYPHFRDLVNSDSIDRQNGFISLHEPSAGQIYFICINKNAHARSERELFSLVLTNGDISSHAWNKSATTSDKEAISSLFALSQQTGNLSIHKIVGSQSTCTTELHRLTLKGLIKEHDSSIDLPVSESQVLNFSADRLTVLVDKQLIVQLCVNETKPWQIVYTIPCPHKVLYASVTGAVVAMLDNDHSTLLYDLKNGNFLAVIKRQEEEGKNWVSCRLTKDYLHMVFQNDAGQLYSCNLDLFFHENSLLLSRSEGQPQALGSDSSVVHWFSNLTFSDNRLTSGNKKIHSSKSFTMIPFTGDCLSYQCTLDYASALCHHKGSMKIVSYSMESGRIEELKVNADQHVVLSNIESIPHLIVSDSGVYAAYIAHCSKFYPQEDAKTGMLDAIAVRNRWSKQSSSHQIRNLKRALEIRKLDYVLEFIRAKSSFIEDIMRSPPIDHRADVDQMCNMMHTVASTYIAHSTTRAFAQQITEAMLTFLKEQERRGITLLNNMLMAENTEKQSLMESLLEKLSDYKMSFNEVLKLKSKKSDITHETKGRDGGKKTSSAKKSSASAKKSSASAKKSSPLSEDLVRKWNSLSSKELIGDGILMGDISLLQAYFTMNNREAEASWDVIVKTGLQCVLDELELRNWSTACQILKNMGFGVFTKLSQIAIYTTDSSLRRYLVEQLKLEGEFTESEQQAILFSEELDRIHPCQSFQQALIEGRSGRYKDFPVSDVFMVNKLCGEIGVVPSSHNLLKSRWHSHYMLDWMAYLIPNKDNIIIDRYIHEDGSSSEAELAKIEPEVIWAYLCRHNMIDMILHWVNVQYCGTKATHDFQNQPITTSMIDICCATLPVNSRVKVQSQLALHGKLDSSGLSSVQSRFSGLCRSGLILDRSKAECLLSVEEFISHCLRNNLLELLYEYFALWGISDSDVRRMDSNLSGKDYLQLLMLYSFYKLSLCAPGAKQILDASLASSRYLSRNPFLMFSEQLDQQQLTDVALCNLMYHSPLMEGSEVSLTPEQLSLYKDHSLLKHLLDTEAKLDDSQVITIYTLLKKWGTLREGRLFAVQISETESSSEMPHFANQALAARHGVEDKLTFLYYLKQARPSFAFVVFLSDEISMCSGTTIPASRVNLTVSQTHFLAVKFYENIEIAASCVAFLELMGENTELLRLLVNTAHILHKGKQLCDHSLDPKELHHQVESLLLPLIFGKKKSMREAYSELVQSADVYISSLVESSTSIEAGLKWRTVVAFSRRFKLPLPTKFLELCAPDNHWLSFLVYSQIFNYERFQLINAVNMFTKDSIREHLQCVLDSNNSSPKSEQSEYSSTQHDMRTQLHQSMTVESSKRHSDRSALISSSEDETRKAVSDRQSVMNTNPLPAYHNVNPPVSLEHIPNDVFAILFLTSNRNGSWKQLNMYAVLLHNPVLAILAACHKESDPLECLSSWLIGWLEDSDKIAAHYMDPHSGRFLSRSAAIGVLELVIEKYNLLQLFKTGLRLFMKKTALIPLLDAVGELPKQQFFIVSTSLNRFKSSMKKVAQSEYAKESELTFTQLADLSLLIIQSCVHHTDSFLCERFLHLLDEANLFTAFKDNCVNFGHAYKAYRAVYDLRLIGVNRARLVSSQCTDEIKHIIQILESKKEFDKARKLSLSCNLDTGPITVQELVSDGQQMKAQSSWNLQTSHSDFWTRCHNKCIKYDLDPERCSAYFEMQCTQSASPLDKITLSEYSLTWMRQAPSAFESTNLQRLQKLMWQSKISYLLSQPKTESCETSPKERLLVSVSIDKTQFLLSQYKHGDFLQLLGKSKLPEAEGNAVCQLIEQLLNRFHVDEACQVSVEYGCTTQDVLIILVCMGLAMKVVDPVDLDDRIKSIYAERLPFKRRSSSLSQSYLLAVSGDSFTATAGQPSAPSKSDDCLVVLEKLSAKCLHGVMSCNKIVCCYAIALALEQPYRDTVLQSEYSLLKQLLSSKVGDRFELALDYINTCSLSDSDIASFLASNVYNSLRVMAGLDNDIETASEQMAMSVDSCMKAGRDCKQLIQLFADQTVFGQSLLEQATTMCIDEPDIKLKLVVKVELLILSHDAYSCAYDMEGISSVLRACRACAIQINEASYYSLMIHMLTGIGRFSEMTYIFDTLKQNHQFELLFRKGMSKDNKLKLAVLDYLRRFCPGDNDIYRVVSSHFAMYREIAQLLEQSALKKLGQLRISSFRHTDQLSSILTDIQKNLTDAAEIYIEGQCLRHAQNCVKQARLVFLQSSLISSGIQVINLDTTAVKSFIGCHDKFYEIFTVSDAYGKHFWALALCNNVLVKGDMKFLNDFKKSLVLTPSLISEIIQRFQLRTDITRTSQVNVNLRCLLSFCKDVVIKYQLAQSLDLTEVTKELLTADNGALGAVIRDSLS